jgi:DNA polymerase III gamma/tau subunit
LRNQSRYDILNPMGELRNQHIFDFFKKVKDSGNLAHGYLFWGPEDKEKTEIALWLGKALEISDFDILRITTGEEKKEISINQIRAVKKHLGLSPFSGLYKLVIIDGAEKMNSEAANALLKILEEPHRNTILILITSEPELLPGTIVSRLQEIRFRPVSLNQVAKTILNKKYIDILDKSLNNIFKDAEKISKEETEIIPLLDSWIFWFREKMIEDAKSGKESRILNIIREIQKTKNLISSTNVNQRLALENLILCIKK